jgi:hypothetical protein
MSAEIRGVTHLRTMASLVDSRRKRTSYGALLELSMLELEKQRITVEMQRADRRSADIRIRIEEINIKAHRLHVFVERPDVDLADTAAESANSVPLGKVKSQHLSY